MLTERHKQMRFAFGPTPVSVSEFTSPAGYRGLSAFHKYWGKKPIECLGFLVEKFSQPHDLVLDPFLGSGLLARECAVRKRRFIGIDINPVSIELARLMVDLPALDLYESALTALDRAVRRAIDESYKIEDGRVASHYLWDGSAMKEVWIAGRGGSAREVLTPTVFDRNQFAKYEHYTSRTVRPLHFFHNARINTSPTLGLSDIFTGRALRNIDLVLEQIGRVTGPLHRALLLTLTASVGQMSNMVFAVTNRGKTTGDTADKIEVGSWVIGYWRPLLHFEINAWNCFERRAKKLIGAITNLGAPLSFSPTDKAGAVVTGSDGLALLNDDSLHSLREMPSNSVALVLTDPPHSDRIPYLELSELWNAILSRSADLENEIVFSNARERGKTKAQYNQRMAEFLAEVERVLIPWGTLALLFNARDAESWRGVERGKSCSSLSYYGCFPMSYSANSVVQDNRGGAMKSDFVLIYRKHGSEGCNATFQNEIKRIPGWSEQFPKVKGDKDALHVSGG